MAYEGRRDITNSSDRDVELIVEPWAAPAFTLPPGATFTIVARGTVAGELEVIEEPGSIVVFASPTTTATVYQEDVVLFEFPIAVPDLPPGMTTRSFLNLVLGVPYVTMDS